MTPEKTPENFNWIIYVSVIGLSAIVGFVSFVIRVKARHARSWNIVEMIAEICTSAFASGLIFYLCQWRNLEPLLTAIFSGIAACIGSRSIMFFEQLMESEFAQEREKS